MWEPHLETYRKNKIHISASYWSLTKTEIFIDRHTLKKFPLGPVVLSLSSPVHPVGLVVLEWQVCPCCVLKPPCSALMGCSGHLRTEWVCHACGQFPRINQLQKSCKTNKLNFLVRPCLDFKLGLRGERLARAWQPTCLVHSTLWVVAPRKPVARGQCHGEKVPVPMVVVTLLRSPSSWCWYCRWGSSKSEGLCENHQWHSLYLGNFLMEFSLE